MVLYFEKVSRLTDVTGLDDWLMTVAAVILSLRAINVISSKELTFLM